MSEPTTPSRRRTWLYVVMPLGVLAAVAIGAAGFFGEYASRNVEYIVTGPGTADSVEVRATVQNVDAAGREMVLQVLVVPHGSYADPGEPEQPSVDLVLDTSSVTTAPLRYRAHERITATDLRVPIDGVVSFFPFDRYDTQLYAGVDAAGVPAPVQFLVDDHDPDFVSQPGAIDSGPGYVAVDVTVWRSRSTYILAGFQVVVMWALGLSVLAGAIHIVRRRLGLMWDAMGWMAATLFALVGFRNAAPGLPPIGSLIDYCAFFWAEAIITFALVLVVVKGLGERRRQLTARERRGPTRARGN